MNSLTKLVLAALSASLLQAQPAGSKFEVASVRSHVAGSGFTPLSCQNGRLTAAGYPLIQVITWAFNLNADQYREIEEHLPKWMSPTTPAYDIAAKSEAPATDGQCRQMTQALLADRFKFAAHWESRAVEVSDLVAARSGLKLEPALETDQGSDVSITLNGRPLVGARAGQPKGMTPKGMTMDELAEFLGSGRRLQPIVNQTGIEGRYKIDLRFSIQPPGNNEPLEDPDLETALQRQLGLKLETHKGFVKVLVVDHIEPAGAN